MQQNQKFMQYESKIIPISELRTNNGQLDGVPTNPRKISKKDLEKLRKSLRDFPEMLKLRELVVVPFGDTFVVLGGNQRLTAAKAEGFEDMPCKVLAADTPAEVLREFVIKDNQQRGEDDWDLLKDWDADELQEWGVDFDKKPNGAGYSHKVESPIYEPSEICPSVDMIYSDKRYTELLERIEAVKDKRLRKFLTLAAARFVVIDFELVADFYAFQDAEIQELFEDLALVIPDFGNAIENGFVRLNSELAKIRKEETNAE